MARKKKKRARSFNAAPLLILAMLFGAAVVWAVWPHRHAPRRTLPAQKPVAQVTPAPAPVTPQPAAPARSAAPSPSPAHSPLPAGGAPSAAPTAVPTMNPNGPEVALIVDDCGQWIDTERALIALPIPITFAVLPYVRYTKEVAQDAAQAGKGVMLHLPMEPISHIDPGPGEIKTGMTDAQVATQMEADVAQVPLAKGINNHEGSEATADVRVMKDVMAVAKEHGLFFVDSRTTAKTVAAAQAIADGVPTASRNVFLDDRPDVAYTESMLEQAVAVAKADGSAIAIGHPKPTTLEAIRLMYPKMEAEGIRFVLVQTLVH